MRMSLTCWIAAGQGGMTRNGTRQMTPRQISIPPVGIFSQPWGFHLLDKWPHWQGIPRFLRLPGFGTAPATLLASGKTISPTHKTEGNAPCSPRPTRTSSPPLSPSRFRQCCSQPPSFPPARQSSLNSITNGRNPARHLPAPKDLSHVHLRQSQLSRRSLLDRDLHRAVRDGDHPGEPGRFCLIEARSGARTWLNRSRPAFCASASAPDAHRQSPPPARLPHRPRQSLRRTAKS